jgi:hypothetical protein
MGASVSTELNPRASHYALDCKNLDWEIGPHQIRIPAAKLFQPPPDPSATKPIPVENIACSVCKHVYEYTRGDLRHISDQDPILSEPSCISIEFICDEPDCKAVVLMHTTRGETESKKDVIARLRQSVFHVLCANYHFLHFPRNHNSIIRIGETALRAR